MEETKAKSENRCSAVEKKRLEFDLAYCDVTYNSNEGRKRCYEEAKKASLRREIVCRMS